MLAGCLGGTGSPGTETPPDGGTTADGENSTRPRGSGGPGVGIVGTDDAPDLPVRIGVEVVTEAASSASPPELRVTVTNATDRRLYVGEGRAVVFAYVPDESGQLILLPTGGDYPAQPDCWRLSEPVAVTEEYRITELGAGESTEQLLGLYALPGEDACLPVGEFRFTTTLSVAEDEHTVPSEGNSEEWGFSVTLE